AREDGHDARWRASAGGFQVRALDRRRLLAGRTGGQGGAHPIVKILVDDLQHPAVRALIREHLDSMYAQSPPESVHALGIDALRGPGITFWCAWDGNELLGCGAMKELDPAHGEIKSMRTPNALRRRGAGR